MALLGLQSDSDGEDAGEGRYVGTSAGIKMNLKHNYRVPRNNGP